jgi:pilus assembly protein CpaC
MIRRFPAPLAALVACWLGVRPVRRRSRRRHARLSPRGPRGPADPPDAGGVRAAAHDQVLSIDLTAGAGARAGPAAGKSAIIELPTDVRDMLVTNPLVADAVLRSPRRIYVLGLAAGATDAVFFDAAGRRILQLNIRVGQDTSLLEDTLNRVIPGRDHQGRSAQATA